MRPAGALELAVRSGLSADVPARLRKRGYRDKLRGYRLGPRAKATLLESRPDRFASYLTGDTDTNRLKCEIDRRLRLHRLAETYVTMDNAGVCVYRDEKPAIFAPDGYAGGRIVYSKHPEAKYLRSCKASAHVPEWRRLEEEAAKTPQPAPKPAPAAKKPAKRKATKPASPTDKSPKEAPAPKSAGTPEGIITTDKDSILS